MTSPPDNNFLNAGFLLYVKLFNLRAPTRKAGLKSERSFGALLKTGLGH
jgi:hypothetical protein